MRLYTLVLDHRGGTYLSQLDADDEIAAVSAWCHRLLDEQWLGADSSAVANAILREDLADGVVALEGLHGVWCTTAAVGEGVTLLNVIRSARADA